MSDRKMLGLMCLLACAGYLGWIALNEGSGQLVTSMIEVALSIPHILAAMMHLLGLAAVFGIGLRLLLISSAQ